MRGSPEHSRPDKIVHTGELPSTVNRKHKFGKAQFCLPDFEFVNRCAYFDYQRDRAYLRIKKDLNISIPKPRLTSKRRRRAKINKRIEVSLKRCPFCNSRRISQGQAISTRIVEMKFLDSGVKKWVTAYSSWLYHCDKCGNTFSPPGYPEKARRYGDGLVNWITNENVARGQNMMKVERCLREVFKLNIPQPTLHRFKARVTKRYESTKEAIFAELLRGPSLNVDETEARLLKEKATVWVYAGVNGIYYECRESRNGQFLTERLKGFGGVLVSDFFTAYDSIACPKAHPVVPGRPICGMRLPCGGCLRRAREGIEWPRAIGVSTVPGEPRGRGTATGMRASSSRHPKNCKPSPVSDFARPFYIFLNLGQRHEPCSVRPFGLRSSPPES